jgi:hypothetical protein
LQQLQSLAIHLALFVLSQGILDVMSTLVCIQVLTLDLLAFLVAKSSDGGPILDDLDSEDLINGVVAIQHAYFAILIAHYYELTVLGELHCSWRYLFFLNKHFLVLESHSM